MGSNNDKDLEKIDIKNKNTDFSEEDYYKGNG